MPAALSFLTLFLTPTHTAILGLAHPELSVPIFCLKPDVTVDSQGPQETPKLPCQNQQRCPWLGFRGV